VTTLSLAVILQASILAAGDDTYAEAHAATTKTGKPMVVLVGAEWCAPCQTMKKTVIPQVKRHGLLGRVAFAVVNLDRDRELAQRLTSGGPIPQLIMYRKAGDGWRRQKLVGGEGVAAVEAFVSRGLEDDAAEKKSTTAKRASTTRKAESPKDKQASTAGQSQPSA